MSPRSASRPEAGSESGWAAFFRRSMNARSACGASRSSLAPEPARTDGVKCADRQAAAALAEQDIESLPHLGGGLVREGDSEDLVGPHAVRLDQVRDAVSEHPRLAAAGPGKNQERPIEVGHCLPLRRVQLLDVDHGAPEPTRRERKEKHGSRWVGGTVAVKLVRGRLSAEGGC